MKVLIKSSDFESKDPYNRIYGIIKYVNALRYGLVTDNELDENIPEAQEVYFVDYYVMQVDNGGLAQYFQNTNFSKEQSDIVLSGLKNMSAIKHYELLKNAFDLILGMDDQMRDYFYSDMKVLEQLPELKEIRIKLREITDEFFRLNEAEESIDDLNFEYVNKIPSLEIVSDQDYDSELQKILDIFPADQKIK